VIFKSLDTALGSIGHVLSQGTVLGHYFFRLEIVFESTYEPSNWLSNCFRPSVVNNLITSLKARTFQSGKIMI
jgi:hypothetical protein